MITQDITTRRHEIEKIIINLKKQGKQITRYTVQDELEKKNIKISSATVSRDLTVINRENTYIRDLSESNYSAYQEQISDTLNWIEQESRKQWLENKSHVFLNIIMKTQDLKMKHTNGENINISAALLGKKFGQIKSELDKHEEQKVDVVKLASQIR